MAPRQDGTMQIRVLVIYNAYNVSTQDLHLCSAAPGEVRSCRSSTFAMKDAITAFLAKRRVVTEDCLPYNAHRVTAQASTCQYRRV